jgi:hypothetical protein
MTYVEALFRKDTLKLEDGFDAAFTRLAASLLFEALECATCGIIKMKRPE